MNILQLTTSFSNSNPQWSPDSRYLVFVSKRDGNPEIYRMDLNGASQTRLTNDPAIDLNPVWQPAPIP
jgi:TolB protein